MNKETLRLLLLKRRAQIPLSRKINAGKKACIFLKSKLVSYSYVLSFFPLKGEIDITLLNKDLLSEGRLLLPRVSAHTLEFYKVENLDSLTKSSYNVFEPKADSKSRIKSFQNCAILVPGLGFSENTRIGYGKGCYDYFLSANKSLYKLGIGYQEQACISIYSEDHDMPLTEIFLF